jgi:hypothetical protein
MRRSTSTPLPILLLSPLLLLSGCGSAFISASLRNHGQQPVRLVEVDYPSASFGVGTLAPGSEFRYRFKVQGSGPLKLEFTDGGGKVHEVTGPDVQEGRAGNLVIEIDSSGQVHWTL